MYRVKVKLATVVEDDPKSLFSIATTPRSREERYSFPWIRSFFSENTLTDQIEYT